MVKVEREKMEVEARDTNTSIISAVSLGSNDT